MRQVAVAVTVDESLFQSSALVESVLNYILVIFAQKLDLLRWHGLFFFFFFSLEVGVD